MDEQFYPFYLKLPPARIVDLKFLLESYEGLGILRTLNRKTGFVVILALQDSKADIERFIADVGERLEMRLVAPPPQAENEDWLLASEE